MVVQAKLGENDEKALVLQISSKSRSIFIENHWFFKQNGDFESGREENPPTGRINGLGGWVVAVWRVWERKERERRWCEVVMRGRRVWVANNLLLSSSEEVREKSSDNSIRFPRLNVMFGNPCFKSVSWAPSLGAKGCQKCGYCMR